MASWSERIPGEGARAFNAFLAYRDLGPERSIDKAYRVATQQQESSRRASGTWMNWAAQFEWVERARAYDGYLEAKARRSREREYFGKLEAFRGRQELLAQKTLEVSIQLLEIANRRMKKLLIEDPEKAEEIALGLVPAYARAAASTAEAATNAEAAALGVEELGKAYLDERDRGSQED